MKRPPYALALLASSLAVSAALALSVGPDASVDWKAVLEWGLSAVSGTAIDERLAVVIGELRAPRVALAVFVGMALGLSGAIMQALFSNPLAEPYVTGISAGAALGAIATLSAGLQFSIAGMDAMALGGFVGAALVSSAIYRLARRQGRLSPTTLLLIGIAIGGIAQAFTSWFAMRLGPQQLRGALDWLMGSLAYATWPQVLSMTPSAILGLMTMVLGGRLLNLLAQGADSAGALGASIESNQRWFLAIATFLAATSVAACGIVAFVGLLAPHIARAICGPDHRRLLPTAALLGALIVLWADMVARMAIPGMELRLSVTTGVLGGAFLIRVAFRGPLGSSS